MKIAFVIYDLSKGGAERVVSLLSLELSKTFDVTIITFDKNIEYPFGGKIINLNLPSRQGIVKKTKNILVKTYMLRKMFSLYKFDYIFPFMESAYIPSILTGMDVYPSLRTNPERFPKIIQKIIFYLFSFKNVKKIVVPSKELQRKLYNEKLSKAVCIYNPVSLELIEKKMREAIDIDFPYILAVGRLEKVKNFDLLIRAYAMSQVREKVNLIFLGDGSQRSALMQLVKKLSISKNVFFLGNVDNVYKYMANCECVVSTSLYEGFPNTLIEALAVGCAVISTDCPTGPKEIITNNYNGILIPNNDLNKLVQALNKVILDEDFRRILKSNAKKSILSLDISNIAPQWVNL